MLNCYSEVIPSGFSTRPPKNAKQANRIPSPFRAPGPGSKRLRKSSDRSLGKASKEVDSLKKLRNLEKWPPWLQNPYIPYSRVYKPKQALAARSPFSFSRKKTLTRPKRKSCPYRSPAFAPEGYLGVFVAHLPALVPDRGEGVLGVACGDTGYIPKKRSGRSPGLSKKETNHPRSKGGKKLSHNEALTENAPPSPSCPSAVPWLSTESWAATSLFFNDQLVDAVLLFLIITLAAFSLA